MSVLATSSADEIVKASRHRKHRSHSSSPQRWRREAGAMVQWNKGSASFKHPSLLQRESHKIGGGVEEEEEEEEERGQPPPMRLTDKQYLDILQSMGQSVHIMDQDYCLVFWNPSAEDLYGFSASEALGHNVFELLVDPLFFTVGSDVLNRVRRGESWTGQFPVRNKRGDRFSILATDTPLYDDDGNFIGVICVSSDSKSFKAPREGMRNLEADSVFSLIRSNSISELILDHHQQLQPTIASKISNLASKVSNTVKSKMWLAEGSLDLDGGRVHAWHSDHCLPDTSLRENHDNAASSGATTPRGDAQPSPFGVSSRFDHEGNSPSKTSQDFGDERDSKHGISRILTLKAEALIGKKGLMWPWKVNESDRTEPKPSRFVWPWSQNVLEKERVPRSDTEALKSESQVITETNITANSEAPGSWSSSANINSTSSASSSGSTCSGTLNKVEMDVDTLDNEISWEDLTIGEQIGQGSCGTVYHALWYGSDVVVKVFSRQEYSDDIVFSFRQEVSLMKKLRHPNVLLFMGVVTCPQRLCIVTEFLPRRSLFCLLQKYSSKLEKRRQMHMALDIVSC